MYALFPLSLLGFTEGIFHPAAGHYVARKPLWLGGSSSCPHLPGPETPWILTPILQRSADVHVPMQGSEPRNSEGCGAQQGLVPMHENMTGFSVHVHGMNRGRRKGWVHTTVGP